MPTIEGGKNGPSTGKLKVAKIGKTPTTNVAAAIFFCLRTESSYDRLTPSSRR
jgi:hypothetical protein